MRKRSVQSTSGETTLSKAQPGITFEMIGLDGGERMSERISSMGLNNHARFQVIANSGHGPVGIRVGWTTLGIGRGMAAKIRVRKIEAD
ncbi:MAG: hypothetical protein DRP45_03945 [Candidatus Zixiibacteriota bacterium]|nr:MAG: hypothetical protein DRP45_03945 [candidate division Zixibacteria bacterium]